MFARHSVSYTASGSSGSSQGSSWWERRHKIGEDWRYKLEGDRSGLGEGSSYTYRSTSGASEHEHHDRRGQELEHLRRMVRDLELEV